MFRTRLIPLALAASLGLVSGCCFSTSWGVSWPRLRGNGGGPCNPCGPCAGGAVTDGYPVDDWGGGVGASPVAGVPVTDGPALPPVEGGAPGTCTNGNGAGLHVAPMPKLVNPEVQAQPAPYAPSSAKGANRPTK